MSYVTHNFVTGHKLTGADMAEMDAQIAANEAAAAAVNAKVDLVPSQRLAALRTLNLTADSDTVYLYLGNELLSYVILPDVSDRVPCTGLTASGTLTGLLVGETAQITATKQPVDCNQSIRYQSSNTAVATVSSSGLVTAVGSGTATITVICGSYSQTLTAKVSRVVSFDNNIWGECGWLSMSSFGDVLGALYNTDGSNEYLANIPFDFDKFKIKNGEKITLTLTPNNWKFRPGFVVKQISGATLSLRDLRDDNDRYLVGGVELVDTITNGSSTYTYTNNTGEDCWIVFTVQHDGNTLSEALTNVDSKVVMVIGPA